MGLEVKFNEMYNKLIVTLITLYAGGSILKEMKDRYPELINKRMERFIIVYSILISVAIVFILYSLGVYK